MTDFVQGQRWVVDSEPELGLGVVVGIDQRAVTLFFDLVESERRYAIRQAPLTRIRFDVDDEIILRDGAVVKVVQVHEKDGLLIYDVGGEGLVVETSLASGMRMNQAYMRLMAGQVENPNWFSFRRMLDNAISRVWHSQLNGLLGVRANLIPHQLYVAWQACHREKVRVLLADEVGLGKTIEAGMIISRLLQLERIQRLVVVVPDTLQVQWLVELGRKFNIRAELYSGSEHELEHGVVHIVPHSAFADEFDRLNATDFDLMVVDEAHQFQVNSKAYNLLAELAGKIPHMVLLTAIPEQLGVESHFARLRLLDPAKFTDLETFLEDEKTYAALNEKIQLLPDTRAELIRQYDFDADVSDQGLLDRLLDCHGIGRVMFRNVRKAVRGFPQRQVVVHRVDDDRSITKFEWLASWLKTKKDEKILVICHLMETVQECEQYLWQKHGIDAAIFHEQQSLIERDKAAAYFADPEHGSSVLLCSEIGSEGRNFQFSCHLVCLDLPDHPDSLEQRIGRLDRIGQTRDVHIHVVIANESASAWRFKWYNEVLNCIVQINPAAGAVHDKYWSEFLVGQDQTIVQAAQQMSRRLQNEIANGRDALLEMNSCRQPTADNLAANISEFEQHTPKDLVERASDLFQFHFEELFTGIYSLIPSDKMLIPALPGIPPEGAEVTFSRSTANAREDLLFITWDSPLIEGLWELLHHSELGSASVATLSNKQLPAGHCLLEVCYDLMIQSPYVKSCLPFLNNQSLRVVVLDMGDNDLSEALPEAALQANIGPVKKHLAREIIRARKAEIPDWFKKADAMAVDQRDAILAQACERAETFFSTEIDRLRSLRQRNSYISEAEIVALSEKRDAVQRAFTEHTQVHVSATRLIVITP